MAKNEINFTVEELVRMTSILNSTPWNNRGVAKLIDGLASIIELRQAEKDIVGLVETQVNQQIFY